MGFDLNKWLEETIDIDKVLDNAYQKVRPRILCEDGFSVSVQASEYTYCEPSYTQWKEQDKWHVINGNFFGYNEEPRKMLKDCFTPYKSVELGFPSEEDELIMEYAEDEDYTNTVYGYAPVEIVEKLIDKHGGYIGTVTKMGQNKQKET